MLKEMKEEVAFSFKLAAGCSVGNTRTSATAASAVLMGGYAEAEIQFSLGLYCIFSPS